MSLNEDIQSLQELIGPKRVKTPNIEVEQFELRDLVQAAQRNTGTNPVFSNFNYSLAVPKDLSPCERTDGSCNCR